MKEVGTMIYIQIDTVLEIKDLMFIWNLIEKVCLQKKSISKPSIVLFPFLAFSLYLKFFFFFFLGIWLDMQV